MAGGRARCRADRVPRPGRQRGAGRGPHLCGDPLAAASRRRRPPQAHRAGGDDRLQVRLARARAAQLEAAVAGTLLTAFPNRVVREAPEGARETIETVSRAAHALYREVVWEDDGFPRFLRAFTPLDELALLDLGSRPVSRPEAAGRDELAALRAIPWVFSWTQTRCIAPAWLGVGAGPRSRPRRRAPAAVPRLAVLRRARRERRDVASRRRAWGSRRGTSRSSTTIAWPSGSSARCARSTSGRATRSSRWSRRTSCSTAIRCSRQSIRLRNPYVDPMNAIQVELLLPPAAPATRPRCGHCSARSRESRRRSVTPADRASRGRHPGRRERRVLVREVAEVRLGVDRPARDPVDRLPRRELAAVPVQVLAQPLVDLAERAALDLLVGIREVGEQPLPDLHERGRCRAGTSGSSRTCRPTSGRPGGSRAGRWAAGSPGAPRASRSTPRGGRTWEASRRGAPARARSGG